MDDLNSKTRVKVYLLGLYDKPIWIDPMPSIPRQDDHIDVGMMLDESKFSDEELYNVFELKWHVSGVRWTKDEKGYIVELQLTGE